MTITELEELWDSDCQIDINNIGEESLNISKLHSKYRKLYFIEKATLTKLQGQYKILKLEKYEFLINPTEEKVKAGWQVPAQGKLMKSEVSSYLEGDKMLVELEMKISLQNEKVEFIKSILDHLKNRGFLIKNYIEDRKWLSGS